MPKFDQKKQPDNYSSEINQADRPESGATLARAFQNGRRIITRFRWLWRKGKPSPVSDPLLPGGLSPKESARRFEAVIESVQTARRQNLGVPLELSLSDFTFSPDEDNKIVAQLLLSPSGRAFQAPSQDQPALARLIYQLIMGRALPTSGNIEPFLQNLSQPLETFGMTIAFPELASVIRRGLHGEYGSLGELNGAFGWALYQQSQLELNSERHSLIGAAENQSEIWEASHPTQPNAAKGGIGLALRRNKWVLVALVGLNLVAIVALFGVLGNPALFKSSTPASTKEANQPNPFPTFTPDTGFSPTAVNAANPTSGVVGVAQLQIDPSQLTGQSYIAPADLKTGQAELLRPPVVQVIGQRFDESTFQVGVSTSDGNYNIYKQYEPGKQPGSKSTLQAQKNLLGACWSPNGKNLAALTIDGQIVLNEPDGNVSQKFSLESVNPEGNQITNPCWELFGWSPDSKKLLIYGDIVRLWSFGTETIEQVVPKNFLASSTDATTVIWSADSTSLGIFSDIDGSEALGLLKIYDANSLDFINNIDLEARIAHPDQVYVRSNIWSPDGRRIARLVETRNQNETGSDTISESLQIFTLPNNQGSLDNPAKVELIQANPLGSGNAPPAYFPFQSSTIAWLPTNNRIAVYRTVSLPPDSTVPRGEITIYTASPNDTLTFLTKFSTYDYVVNYMAWKNSTGASQLELLTSDQAGSLRMWSLSLFSGSQPEINSDFVALNGQAASIDPATIYGEVSWSPNQRYIAFQSGQAFKLFDTTVGRITYQANTADFFFDTGQWSADSQFYATRINYNQNGRYYQAVNIWKMGEGQPELYRQVRINEYNVGFQPTPIETFAFDPQQAALLIVNSDSYLLRYDLSQPLPPLDQQEFPDNVPKRVNPTPIVTDTAAPKSVYTVIGQFTASKWLTESVVAWSHKRDMLMLGSSRNFTIVHLQIPTQNGLQPNLDLTVIPDGAKVTDKIIKVEFSPDDKLVAFGINNGTVKIYSTETGKLVTNVAASQTALYDFEFSPAGHTLATASNDRLVRIWQVGSSNSWRLIQILSGHASPVRNLVFSSSSQDLLTTDFSGAMLLWRLN